jgi:hypothetical protein
MFAGYNNTMKAGFLKGKAVRFSRIGFYGKDGQATVEFLLLLSSIVGVLLITGAMFHKKIIGAFFSIFGMIIGGASSQ